MKKILTTISLLCMVMSMSASFHLSVSKWVEDDVVCTDVTKDTTIIVTEYEYDEELEEATMGVEGTMYSDESQEIVVTLARSKTGIFDQFCAGGMCMPGNSELSQEFSFTVGSLPSMRRWYTHYTAFEAGNETITYTFNDGVNPTITLTVKYCYLTSAVESVVVPNHDGAIYNILGRRMPSNNLSELPAGIYVINGKKIYQTIIL